MGLNYYDVLGVKKSAATKEIEAAYRKVSKNYHPDATDGLNNPAYFAEATQARDTLVDPAKRREYDQFLDGPASREAPRASNEPPPQRPPFRDSYGNPTTDEERARHDAGTRQYGEARKASTQSAPKPLKPKEDSWWWPKSPSLLVFFFVGSVWYESFNSLAKSTGMYFFHLFAVVGYFIACAALICARFVSKERSKKFWKWARGKVTAHATSKVKPSKVDASK